MNICLIAKEEKLWKIQGYNNFEYGKSEQFH